MTRPAGKAALKVDLARAALAGTAASGLQFAASLLLVRFPDLSASEGTYQLLRVEGAKAAAVAVIALLLLYRLRRAGGARWPLVAPLSVAAMLITAVLLLYGLQYLPPWPQQEPPMP